MLAAARAKLGVGEERLEDLAAALEDARRRQVEDAAAELEADKAAAASAAAAAAARARIERKRAALDGTLAAAVAAAAAGARGAVEVRCSFFPLLCFPRVQGVLAASLVVSVFHSRTNGDACIFGRVICGT